MPERKTAAEKPKAAPAKPKRYVVAEGKSINCTRKGTLVEGDEVVPEFVGQTSFDAYVQSGVLVPAKGA